ncbi:hypothetical protein J5N58_17030 [Rhizobium cremeum]|uniref:hypothetical protein n=1 Tax=Rhizobium cremeum TaxID=2813827 RepID=UPI001FD3BB96|nr:hypothetical protein [Rhizobium cremeum]MCJ7996124.1 hypothetical protein [Rhizobium cremeum]MCJ8001383.1 hypothetical protein [Rhizobium cremeum]
MTTEDEKKTPEIEITPEMIEAGVSEYVELAGEFPPSYVVEVVYLAMVRASLRHKET